MPTSDPSDSDPELRSNYQIAEFTSLREEILKRLDAEIQLVTLTLIAAGTLVTVNMQTSADAQTVSAGLSGLTLSALLVFPIIAMFLAAAWAHHDLRIGQIRRYIHEVHELGNPGWESYRVAHRVRGTVFGIPIGVIAARGVFVTTQIAVLIIALSRIGIVLDWNPVPHATMDQKVILISSILATLLTIVLVRRRGRKRHATKP